MLGIIFMMVTICTCFQQGLGLIRYGEMKSVYFSPNDVIYRHDSGSKSRKPKQDLKDATQQLEQLCFDPDDLIRRTSRALFTKGQEPYRIGTIKFLVAIRATSGVKERNVVVERTTIFGLSDFSFIEDAKSDEDGGCPVMYFKWSRLKAICHVITEMEGLKTSGEASMRAEEPLYMRVSLMKPDSPVPSIEMSQVNDVKVEIQGLETASDDLVESIKEELESKFKETLNSVIRNVLTDFVQSSLMKQSLSKLTHKVD